MLTIRFLPADRRIKGSTTNNDKAEQGSTSNRVGWRLPAHDKPMGAKTGENKMQTKLISAATAVMAFVLLIAGNALAQDFDPCAGLTGKAKGLCTAYIKGMGCSSDSANALDGACANVATMFEEVTGSPPPSDCPCDLSLERIRSTSEGWDINTPHACLQSATFDPSVPPLGGSRFGKDKIDLHTIALGPSNGDSVFVALAAIGNQVLLQCEYRALVSGTNELLGDNLFTFDPNYGTTIEDLINGYNACKGAISILATNVNLASGDNNCTFD